MLIYKAGRVNEGKKHPLLPWFLAPCLYRSRRLSRKPLFAPDSIIWGPILHSSLWAGGPQSGSVGQLYERVQSPPWSPVYLGFVYLERKNCWFEQADLLRCIISVFSFLLVRTTYKFSELYTITIRTRLRGQFLPKTQMYLSFILSIEQWMVTISWLIDKDIYSLSLDGR